MVILVAMKDSEELSELIDVPTVARVLRVPVYRARRPLATRTLPGGLKIGRTWRIRPEDLEKWITERVTQP
jgi:hypothetical protein